MTNYLRLLNVVALLKNIPGKKLQKGQVGTVVELLGNGYCEIEFCNNRGETIALIAVAERDLMLLHYELKAA